jgi:enoyl-CoA hydratase/carnithine racemase
VRVVVVRGRGQSFSSGIDVSVLDALAGSAAEASGRGVDDSVVRLAGLDDESALRLLASYQDAFRWLRRPDLVSVAAVQGHAIGAGFQLALACDLRVVADDARLCMAETSLGLVPDLGGTGALLDLVGYSRALELCLTARQVGAAEARTLGLAELVVPLAELDGAVSDLVDAVLSAPRDAVVETKALLLRARRAGEEERLAAEREAQLRRLRDLAGAGE